MKPDDAPTRRDHDQTARVHGARNGGMNDGYRPLSELLAGLLLFGGIGWLVDHFLHTTWALPVGLAVGLGLAAYAVYLRQSKGDRPMFEKPESTHHRARKGDAQ